MRGRHKDFALRARVQQAIEQLCIDVSLPLWATDRKRIAELAGCNEEFARKVVAERRNQVGVVDLPGEEWRPVASLAGLYDVSCLGRVRTRQTRYGNPRCVLLSARRGKRGYLVLTVLKAGRPRKTPVHMLVAEAFVGPRPEGMVVNHKDGNKLNNTPGNLEWVTQAENRDHATVNGLIAKGTDFPQAKLTDEAVRIIRSERKYRGVRLKLAAQFGVAVRTIGNVRGGESWRHVR